MKTVLVIFFTVCLGFSCSSEKPVTTVTKGSLPIGGETGAPYALEISPNGATREISITVDFARVRPVQRENRMVGERQALRNQYAHTVCRD